jgi:metal-sulfur cluster biosynthetic enzyme
LSLWRLIRSRWKATISSWKWIYRRLARRGARQNEEDPEMPGQEAVYEILKQVYDPEVGINIVDMGLIYGVEIEDNKIDLIMTLTSPACPAGPHILQQIDDKLKEMEGVEDVDIRVVWTPPWSPDMLSEEAKDQLGIF